MNINSAFNYGSITRLVYVLLLVAIVFALTNFDGLLPVDMVKQAVVCLVVLLSVICMVNKSFIRFIVVKNLFPLLVASLSLTIWAAIVYLYTDTLALKRILTMGIGIGILLAVYYSVDSVYRIKLMLLVIVLATCVSALFGIGIAIVGNPFFIIWLKVVETDPKNIEHVLINGRTAGLAVTTITLSYQLALAIPLAFAMLLYNPLRGRAGERAWDGILYLLLTILIIVAITNASRSMILGAVCGIIVVMLPSVFHPSIFRRLYFILPMVIVGTLTFFILAVPLDRQERMKLAEETVVLLESESESESESEGIAASVRTALKSSGRYLLELDPRIFSFKNRTTLVRLPMAMTAIRYSLEYPFGTGRYSPGIRHINSDIDAWSIKHILSNTPHNQFLVILVYYGFPGLILLTLFYVYVLRSLIDSARLAILSLDSEALFLVATIAGGMTGYMINSLLHNKGPFVGDWHNFLLIGLVFSAQRILTFQRKILQ